MHRTSYFLKLILIMSVILSCSKEEFTAPKQTTGQSTSAIETYSSTTCSGHTLIKPPVDFLFVWDNSHSSNFINNDAKAALQNTVNYVSDRFDYRILVAPLYGGNSKNFIRAENPTGLNSFALGKLIANDDNSLFSAFNSLASTGGHTVEKGFERTVELLNYGHSNGIFRQGSYVVAVIISNGDDNSYYLNPPSESSNFTSHYNSLMSIKNSTLKSSTFHFISLVAHTNACKSGYKTGGRYREMSTYIKNSLMPSSRIYNRGPFADSFDICSTSFTNIFDEINQSIQDTVIAHVYNYWPVIENPNLSINTNQITAVKSNGTKLTSGDTSNGFTYAGYLTNLNTRELPTAGEPKTGHMIQLYGNGKITYPECLIVTTQAPAEYWGYIVLPKKPKLSTLTMQINGITYTQSTTNGWSYLGFKSAQNTKVVSLTDLSEGSPAEYKTGYVLKLYGNAVFTNNSVINVSYWPDSV